MAAEQDYTWGISGALSGLEETNEILVSVTSDSLLTAATVEVHYDTTLLEFVPYEDPADYLAGRVTVFEQTPILDDTGERVRVVLFDFSMNIPPGEGEVLKFLFKVKDGVAGGTQTTLTLTRKGGSPVLATQIFEIEGSIWESPGDPKQFGWKLKGLAVADSSTTEVYIVLNNSQWITDMVLNLAFDPAVLEISDPDTDVTLKGRATDVNLDVAYTAGSGEAQLTFTKTTSTPPWPYIDPGSGTIVGISFALTGLAAGESTTLDLALDDNTALATLDLEARTYSGPTADVDGNGSTTIFDVLEFLGLWQNSPPTPFTDVNGDGKSDIFDLLAILTAMKQQ
jgi:hypothetical protein